VGYHKSITETLKLDTSKIKQSYKNPNELSEKICQSEYLENI